MVEWNIGVMALLRKEGPSLEKVGDFGLTACQLVNWDTDLWGDLALAGKVRAEADERGIRITALWAGVPGPEAWDFVNGPAFSGIVPKEYRSKR